MKKYTKEETSFLASFLKNGTNCLSNNYVVLFFDPDDEKWNVVTNSNIFDEEEIQELYTIHYEDYSFEKALSIFSRENYFKKFYNEKQAQTQN